MRAALPGGGAAGAARGGPGGAGVVGDAGKGGARRGDPRAAGSGAAAAAARGGARAAGPAAIRAAARAAGSWRLDGLTLVVTLEPCTMCAGAVTSARLGRLVFGAADPRAGAVGSIWDVVRDQRLTPVPEVIGGVLADESL